MTTFLVGAALSTFLIFVMHAPYWLVFSACIVLGVVWGFADFAKSKEDDQ